MLATVLLIGGGIAWGAAKPAASRATVDVVSVQEVGPILEPWLQVIVNNPTTSFIFTQYCITLSDTECGGIRGYKYRAPSHVRGTSAGVPGRLIPVQVGQWLDIPLAENIRAHGRREFPVDVPSIIMDLVKSDKNCPQGIESWVLRLSFAHDAPGRALVYRSVSQSIRFQN